MQPEAILWLRHKEEPVEPRGLLDLSRESGVLGGLIARTRGADCWRHGNTHRVGSAGWGETKREREREEESE